MATNTDSLVNKLKQSGTKSKCHNGYTMT